MHKHMLYVAIFIAMHPLLGLADPVSFSEGWEDDTAWAPPSSPWYTEPCMPDGSFLVGAGSKYDRTGSGNQGILVNYGGFDGKDAGNQAMLVPNGQWVEATDSAPLTVRYYAKSQLSQQADWYFEVSMGDMHAPRLADVGAYNPLPDPIPVLAYCKPMLVPGEGVKTSYLFDGQTWRGCSFISDNNVWKALIMTVDTGYISVPGQSLIARQYLGGFDRVSIYTRDYLSWAYTVIDDIYIAGGNIVDPLSIVPVDGFSGTGVVGGPFVPQCKTYTLTNITASPLDWAATKTENWLSITPDIGILPAGNLVEVDVCINTNANSLPLGIYTDEVAFTSTGSSAVQTRAVELTVRTPDYFTELFAMSSDLNGNTLTLTPDGSVAYYQACNGTVDTVFLTDPAGGTALNLSNDDFEQVTLDGGAQVWLYGNAYSDFYVGSNGYITFGSGDTDATSSLADHFSMPRISGLFLDLDPDPGAITWKQLMDRAVVTWQSVPEVGMPGSNSFQIEMFFDGRIRITWLTVYAFFAFDALAGVSEGNGTPGDYQPSDLDSYLSCPPDEGHPADYDGDGDVDLDDYGHFQACLTGADIYVFNPSCAPVDFDQDADVDDGDLGTFLGCISGPGIPMTESCDD